LTALREAALLDHAAIARVKLPALRRIWERHGPETPAEFLEEGGEALRLHALFDALGADLTREGKGAGWHSWPTELQEPEAARVQAFAEEQADEVSFYIWLQWIADQQLRSVAERATQAASA